MMVLFAMGLDALDGRSKAWRVWSRVRLLDWAFSLGYSVGAALSLLLVSGQLLRRAFLFDASS
jgi:multisubunit Na+/H+ antiporter MnhB subunit